MTDADKLRWIRLVHTAIYLVMVAAIFVVLGAAVTGWVGVWLWVALGLLAVETVVFVGYGFKCPLTGMAVRYGAKTGHVFDTFLPEKATRYTFQVFGTLMVIGVVLLRAQWVLHGF